MRHAVLALALILAATPALAAPWTLSVTRQSVMLSDADDSGEDAATTLQCKPKSGRITVHFFLEKRVSDTVKAGTLTVKSGAVSAQFAARATPEEMYGGNEIEATVPADAPVVAAFAKTGVLRLTAWGETARGGAIPLAKAAGLVKACAR
jgi:hypothetical protein